MEEIRGDEYDTLKGKDNMQEQLFFMMKQATRSGLTTSTQQVAFLHLDVVDRQAPSQEQLCEGVNWILDKNKSGKGTVYVHCKAGRARSATLVAAYLIEVVNSVIYLGGAISIQRKLIFEEKNEGGGCHF